MKQALHTFQKYLKKNNKNCNSCPTPCQVYHSAIIIKPTLGAKIRKLVSDENTWRRKRPRAIWKQWIEKNSIAEEETDAN